MSAVPARLKLAAYEPPEDDLHESVARSLDVLLLPPAAWTTFPSGGYLLTAAARARLYRLGLKTGWPDVLIVFKRIHGIELKVPGGTLSKTRVVHNKRSGRPRIVPGQADVHSMLREAGMLVAVCRSVDAVLDQCAAWGIPLRGHAR